MSNMNLSEQEQIRRASVDELRKLGINPYAAAEYKTNAFAQDIQDNYSPEKNNFQEVCLAGRMMGRRIMGNASFAELMDSSGRIQIYFRRDDICPGDDKTMYNTVFKRLLDIGDIIGVQGRVFKTQMGETTVHVDEFTVLSKSIRPLPIVKEKDGVQFDAVTDPEMRYRQRYVDLIVNPQVRDVFRKRTQIIQSMRELFNSKGYIVMEIYIAYKDYEWMMTFTEEMIKKASLDLHGKTEIQFGDKLINLNPPYK